MDHIEQMCQFEQQKPKYQQLILPLYQKKLFDSFGPKLEKSNPNRYLPNYNFESSQISGPNFNEIQENQQTLNKEGKNIHSQMLSIISHEQKTEVLKTIGTENLKQTKIQKRVRFCISSQLEVKLETKSNEQQQKYLQECHICYIEKEKNQFISPLSCQHEFCTECLSQHLTQKIQTANVLRINCPQSQCSIAFNDSQINNIVSKKVYEKYKRFYDRQIISQNKNVRWCPKPDCENYVIGNGNDLLTCICGQKICFKCGNQFHEGLNCSQAIDAQYLKARLNNQIFDCPNCKVPIQKKGGCNHMTCYKCNYQFCWICRGKYSSYHYAIFNLFGCVFPGGQGFSTQPIKNPQTLRVLMIIPKILLTILIITALLAILPFLLMYLVILAPYEFSKRTCGFKLYRHDRLSVKIGFGIFYFFLGILLSPFTIAIAILSSPCFLIYYFL